MADFHKDEKIHRDYIIVMDFLSHYSALVVLKSTL